MRVSLVSLALILTACSRGQAAPPTVTDSVSLPTPVAAVDDPPPTAAVSTPSAVPATPTTPPPTTTATPVLRLTTTPTAQPKKLDPSVGAAAKSFAVLVQGDHPLTADQAKKAQAALGGAAMAFVSAGDADSTTLQGQLAQALSSEQQRRAVVFVTHLDGRLELIVSVPVAGLVPVIVLEGSSSWKLLVPESGGTMPLDAITSVSEIHDFAGNGRPDVVVTRTTHGASALNTEILVLSWDGQQIRTLFDQTISDWAGPASWKILADNSIELTCPAFGVYDHKLLPHPEQVRSYRWNGSEFALAARQTNAPKTKREMMNLGEADFFAGDFTHAISRYRAVIDDASLADEPDDKVDWPSFARFRLGEVAALTGKQSDAETWLAVAARAAPPLGAEADRFLQAERTAGAAAGFAAVQQSNLPALFERAQMGNLDFPVSLGPFGALGVGVASYLDQAKEPSHQSAAQLATALTKLGFQVKDLTIADLDGDGKSEIAMILPFGSREQTLWLFDRSANGWEAIATVSAPNGLDGLQSIPDHRQAIQVVGPTGSSPSKTLLLWDGNQTAISTSPSALPVPVAINFQSSPNNSAVAEDFVGA